LALCALIVVVSWWATSSVEELAEERRVTFDTTACGDGSKTSGTGVIIGDGIVLTTAHSVLRSGSIAVQLPAGGEAVSGEVVYLDLAADLALLRVDGLVAPPVEYALARSDDEVIVAAGPSDTFRTAVVRPVDVRIEEVGGTNRISRIGYELDVNISLGDSGSGVYDTSGRLVGIVYGRNPDGAPRSFATGKEQLADVLAFDAPDYAPLSCVPSENRILAKQ
jgi:S1-C subfamily serine protease